MDNDSSDSDDLPDLFEDESNDLKLVRPGDIVWAEFRQLPWPALVRSVNLKDKKMSVWYLDSPGLSFKLPWRKIKVFNDKNINEMIRKQVNQSPYKEQHEEVLLRALSYIRRQACGHNDNPRQFFDSSVPYLSIKNIEPCSSPIENQTVSFKKLLSEIQSFKDSDDEISDDDCNEDSILASFSNVLEDSDSDAYDKEIENKIVMYIIAGRTDKHLLDVQRCKIPSVFHDIYEESMQSSRKKLWNINPCDHVRDLEKLREITSYLMDLFEKSVEGGKCVMHRYITAVWLPEAIGLAISLIQDELNGVSCTKRNLMTCKSNSLSKSNSNSKKGCKSKSNKVVANKISPPVKTESIKTRLRNHTKSLKES